MASSEPRVTVSSLESEGVILIDSGSPEFAAALKPGRLKQYDPILPFTVVINNVSGQEIIAYSVVWTCKKEDGSVSRAVRSVYDFSNLETGAQLVSGLREVVSMVRELEAGGRRWDPYAGQLVTQYSACAEVNIAVDAAVFSNGNAIGPDIAHWVPRWAAWLDAEREALAQIANSSPSEVRDLIHGLSEAGLAIARRSSKETPTFAQLGVLADHAATYSESLDLAKAYFALASLDLLERSGSSAIDNVRSMIQGKRYPLIKLERGRSRS